MADDYTPFAAGDSGYWEDPRTAFSNPRLQQTVDPFQERLGSPYRGELKNRPPRPGDPLLPVYEALSPTQGAYSAGQAAGGAWMAGREGRYGEALGELAPLLAAAIPVPGAKGVKVKGRETLPRDLDSLGFYSQALEAAKNLQRKAGPAQGFLNDLQKAGVKKAEMEATKLGEFFAANPNPTKEQLVQHLRDNRVQVREVWYGDQDQPFANEAALAEKYRARGMPPDQAAVMASRVADKQQGRGGDIRWKHHGGQNLLLDPENPTNRESVVHQDPTLKELQEWAVLDSHGRNIGNYADEASARRAMRHDQTVVQKKPITVDASYKEPHFSSVPNYLFHLRTGQYRDAQGRPVLLGDEFQSTRAQTIRDSKTGPRDEAKIAETKQRLADAEAQIEQMRLASIEDVHVRPSSRASGRPEGFYEIQYKVNGEWHPKMMPVSSLELNGDLTGWKYVRENPGVAHDIVTREKPEFANLVSTRDLLGAELRAMQSAPSGHPLVNDMSQTNLTGLRRLLQQAVDSGVEGIALTPGDLQNERYSLSKHVGALRYYPESQRLRYLDPEQAARVRAVPGREKDVRWQEIGGRHKPEDLPGVVGKEMAQRLLAQPNEGGSHLLHLHEGQDIGGAGMREYYDRQYPAVLEKELKRLDPQWPGRSQTKLEASKIQDVADQQGYEIVGHGTPNRMAVIPEPFHYFPLTQRIKEEVAKGLPLFSLGALAAPGIMTSGQEEDRAHDDPFGPSPW